MSTEKRDEASGEFTGPIELSDAEQVLFHGIAFEVGGIGQPRHSAENARRARDLMKSLLTRDAIPRWRLAYFFDADYRIGGRGKSRAEQFATNIPGRVTVERIFERPHFLKYLRYFIQGPALPCGAIDRFHKAVCACGGVTSGDVLPLRDLARSLCREFQLNPRDSADDWFKLALECEFTVEEARMVYDGIRRMK